MTNPASNDPLRQEIDSALEGINLQDLDELGRAPAKGAKGAKAVKGPTLWKGVVAGVSGKDVIVELGPRAQGVIALSEFDDVPKVGDVFEFSAHGQEEGLWKLSRREAKALAAWNEVEVGSRVKARVSGQNTGGLELAIGPLRAFMPASHVALERIENLAQFIGQTFEVEVLEVDVDKKRVLVSRRSVLSKERESQRQEAVGGLAVGQVIQGKVTRVEAFGCFVDLGGFEGLVHVSALSRTRVENPSDVVHVGQQIKAKIMKIEDGGRRIGLSMKELEADPWDEVGNRITPGLQITGRVVRLMEFGAFVEVFPGIEGLLHVSQLGTTAGGKERVRRPQDVVKPGETISVRVLTVDPRGKRIALTRFDERGALIGSEDSVDGSVIDEVLQKTSQVEAKTNLGALFKKAMDKKP
ncbi:MAG: S1 RNA-binding domain-containing protein [Planctomycetes bacterium]|nr:S1 RNA-binding domain-containing protein [Planctomycetota bacterium]